MKDPAKRWILIGSFAFVMIALAVLLPLLFHRSEVKLSVSEPRTVVTPEPTTEEDAVTMRTPAPTPVPVVETPVPVYPPKAVNLLVDGVPLFALDSREVSEQLVRTYLEECAYENLDGSTVLRTASIDAVLSTVPADGSVEYAAFDVALNKLRKNRSLIPVRRTVECAELIIEAPEPQTQTTSLLPEGVRMYRRCGVGARTFVFTETLYKDGLAVSKTETMRMAVVLGIPRVTLVGAYRLPASANGSVPNPNEGERGPVSESLSFTAPIRGKLIGYFGLQTGEMRYGVDYAATPGTRVVAPESGTVVFLGERNGLGFVIEIRHEDGFLSRLCIDSDAAAANLVLDKHVTKGETIATLPETEDAKESVLHYELLIEGIPYNPLYYLP
ncbi:MAG: M23 family metallopeptidase [Clostridia bacterium]|nr:M23 family metallopeptidase [Clostridia bacterium]